MKAIHKPLAYEVWKNVAEEDKDFEPIPDWVLEKAELGAAPDRTFHIFTAHGRVLVRPGDYVVKGPTDTYPCSPEGFAAVYEEQKR